MNNGTSINVPKKYEHMIMDLWHDSDGYWCITQYGFRVPEMDCHTIHEDTQARVLYYIRTIEPCNCDDCKRGLADQNNNYGEVVEEEAEQVDHWDDYVTPSFVGEGDAPARCCNDGSCPECRNR